MAAKRERVGHMVRYQVDFWVPDGDEHRAIISCQHWLEKLPAPEGHQEAEQRGWARKRVRAVLRDPNWPRRD